MITKLEEKVKNLEMKIEDIVYLQEGKIKELTEKIKDCENANVLDEKLKKDLDGISARGAETIFSSTRMRSGCKLQT